MNINHDKSYLKLWQQEKKIGITSEKISRIRFECSAKDIDSVKALRKIADWLEDNFIMYQYKSKDKYKTHQLFFWSNGNSSNYFTIDFNDLYSFKEWDQWTEKITTYIQDNFSNIKGDIYLQYQNCIMWNNVNRYIIDTNFDINNLPYEKLKTMYSFLYTAGSRLSKESEDILINLNNRFHMEFLKTKDNQKVIYNGNKGSIKQIKTNEYGFFKSRQRKTYYPVKLDLINSLIFQ